MTDQELFSTDIFINRFNDLIDLNEGLDLLNINARLVDIHKDKLSILIDKLRDVVYCSFKINGLMRLILREVFINCSKVLYIISRIDGNNNDRVLTLLSIIDNCYDNLNYIEQRKHLYN